MLVYTVQTCESLILTSAVSIFLRFSIYTSCHLQKIILFFFLIILFLLFLRNCTKTFNVMLNKTYNIGPPHYLPEGKSVQPLM